MSSEVPRLSDEQKATIRENWLDAGYGSLELIDAVEQAVRAQWAAEASKVYELLHRTEDEKMALRAERDSAQAEAKALKADAERYRVTATHSCYPALCEKIDALRDAALSAPSEAEPPEPPTLPQSLIDQIGRYGLARTDGLSEIERIHQWTLLIDGIKAYALTFRAEGYSKGVADGRAEKRFSHQELAQACGLAANIREQFVRAELSAQPAAQPAQEMSDDEIMRAWFKWPKTSITSAANAVKFYRSVGAAGMGEEAK